jgi:endo-alpha-1,4-polygalactosaminidase (GH114 family)
MQRQYTKLLLRAFNGECEGAIAKVAWNNASKMEERIRKAFSAINELGSVMQVSIADSYMDLKLTELRLEHELEEKKRAVLEEQRKAREQMREQERAQRELDAEKAGAEEEEAQFAKALEKARVDAARAEGAEHARLTSRILELEYELEGARQKRERVSALAELTRAGYVYVLSNIGSFGEGVFKIGLTRRLDPMDRVKELGDASVPFGFDVHAMVYSEDAPALENAFHERFADRNVNPKNLRKEFFRVSIDELQAFATERDLKIAFTKVPEAREYRESRASRQALGGTPPTKSETTQS